MKKIVEGYECNMCRSTGMIGDCLLFPHISGKNFPVKPRTLAQMKRNLKRYYGFTDSQLEKFHYLEGTQLISDCNGNIYAYFVDTVLGQERVFSWCVCDYNEYIKELNLGGGKDGGIEN